MKSTHEEVAGFALRSFKDHVLTTEHESDKISLYHCGTPGTNNCSFRIIIAPDCITVYGDIGDGMVWRPGTNYMLGWIRGAISSPDYVIEKMPANCKREEFSEERARSQWAYLKECYADNEEKLALLTDDRLDEIVEGDEGQPQEQWLAFMYEELEDDDPSLVMDWTSEVYWTIEALKKFVQLYNQANPGIS